MFKAYPITTDMVVDLAGESIEKFPPMVYVETPDPWNHASAFSPLVHLVVLCSARDNAAAREPLWERTDTTCPEPWHWFYNFPNHKTW